MRNYGSARGGYRNAWFVVMVLQLVQKIADLPRKPPLTLALMAGMAALHLAPELVADFLGAGNQSWLSFGYSTHIKELCLLPASMLAAYQRWVPVLVCLLPFSVCFLLYFKMR